MRPLPGNWPVLELNKSENREGTLCAVRDSRIGIPGGWGLGEGLGERGGYVIESQRAHAREVLATLLWPDWLNRAALSNLL